MILKRLFSTEQAGGTPESPVRLSPSARRLLHDINNHLTVISARAELLEDAALGGTLDPKRAAESLMQIRNASEKIGKITRELRQMAQERDSEGFSKAS